jgi:hypothetical protein
MPALSSFEEFNLTGMDIDDFDATGEIIEANYGAGYGDKAVVGGTLHRWRVSAGVLCDAASYGDPIEGVPSFQYYYDFFLEHTTGGSDIFEIEFRGKRYHASFASPTQSYEMFTIDLFGGGLEIKQRRARGVVYNDDGSIFTPNDLGTALKFWYQVTSSTSVALVQDLSTFDKDLVSEAPFPTLTTNGGVDVIRWDGTNDNPLINAEGSIVISHLYMVACATDATFDASPLRGLISGKTLGLLVSEASTTKWTDLAYGSNFAYKKNGTAFADNNAQAPMSGTLAVIECEFPSTVGIDDYLQIGKDREFSSPTRYWKGDVAMVIGVNNAALTDAQERMLRRFCGNECGITVAD